MSQKKVITNPFAGFTTMEWVWLSGIIEEACRQELDDLYRRREEAQRRIDLKIPKDTDRFVDGVKDAAPGMKEPNHWEGTYRKFMEAARMLHQFAKEQDMEEFGDAMRDYFKKQREGK